ncbi:VOC family protein [Micromonospora sp. NPDC049523]|uniref:VOC family protein n=1 Tax=Micromonospora sp. NPDC049523 TaxID=3155921 RepID=UPI003439463D
MGRPVVHFEIIGEDPARLRGYYGELFGWEFDTGDAVTEKVSQPGTYGFIDGSTTGDGNGINGGVGGGPGHRPGVLFYAGVPDVEDALLKAESLGGERLMGPEPRSGDFTVGQFTDPEGNLIGVAGPSRARDSHEVLE